METEARIRETFRGSLKHATKIIIAQRITSVMEADQIVVVNEGRSTGVGTHDTLLRSNVEYKEIFDSQMEAAKQKAELEKELNNGGSDTPINGAFGSVGLTKKSFSLTIAIFPLVSNSCEKELQPVIVIVSSARYASHNVFQTS